MNKYLAGFIWIVILLIGAYIHPYVADKWQYLFGFTVGAISYPFCHILNADDDD